MKLERKKIEATVIKCTSRLGGISEQQIQRVIDSLMELGDIKSVVDSLALRIDEFFGRPEQKEQYDVCMQELLELAGENYNSIEEILEQVKDNKAKNYIPRRYFC